MNNRTIELRDIACFGGEPVKLELAKTNFIYGPNGTGKSSIAKKLGQLDFDQADEAVSVELFNQDYIHRFIDPDSSIPGVFTVRAGSPEVQERLQQLQGDETKKGEIELARQNLERFNLSHDRQRSVIDEAKKTFMERVWKISGEFPDSLRKHAFRGFLNNRAKFAEEVKKRARLLETEEQTKEPETEQVLSRRFSSLTTSGPSEKVERIGDLPKVPGVPESVTKALAKSLSEDSTNRLSELISRIGNSEWVRQGVDHLEHTGGICPFCQKEIDNVLNSEIRALFDSEYEHAKALIEVLCKQYEQMTEAIDLYLQTVKDIQIADTEVLEKSLLELRVKSEKTSEALCSKLSDMTSTVVLDLVEYPAELEAERSQVNQAISKHNNDLANTTKSLKILKDDIWYCFLRRGDVFAAYISYSDKIEKPTKAIQNLVGKIAVAEGEFGKVCEEYENCKSQLTSANDVKDEINRNLKVLGFQSFRLTLYGDDDQYRIERRDGQIANHLSEGEKTLLSFLYFYQRIQDKAEDKSDAHKMWVVLDDPISSLDSQSLTVISHLCRKLAEKCTDSSCRFERFFLLTHNAYFYQEAIFEGSRQKSEDEKRRLYGLIRKNDVGISQLKFYARNQIESIYELLWQDVREAQSGQTVSASVQNAMRRILEVYFRMVRGGVEGGVIDELALELQLPARSLLSWINDGSHQIRWDLDSAQTNLDNAIYFKAFEQIFDKTGQLGHYDLMMNKKVSIRKSG